MDSTSRRTKVPASLSKQKKSRSETFLFPKTPPDKEGSVKNDSTSSISQSRGSSSSGNSDSKKIQSLEQEVSRLQSLIVNLSGTIDSLKSNVESMRSDYNNVLKLLSSSPSSSAIKNISPSAVESQLKRNNLIFYGVETDELEDMMSSEPEFCRDILETKLKTILRDNFKITRDVAFNDVYRLAPNASLNTEYGPVVGNFKNPRDRENVLRQSKLLKGKGLWITEDCSDKSLHMVKQEDDPLPHNPKKPPFKKGMRRSKSSSTSSEYSSNN